MMTLMKLMVKQNDSGDEVEFDVKKIQHSIKICISCFSSGGKEAA